MKSNEKRKRGKEKNRRKDPKFARKSLDQRKIQREKERGSTIYQRDCEREKEHLSRREFFTPIVSTLI